MYYVLLHLSNTSVSYICVVITFSLGGGGALYLTFYFENSKNNVCAIIKQWRTEQVLIELDISAIEDYLLLLLLLFIK